MVERAAYYTAGTIGALGFVAALILVAAGELGEANRHGIDHALMSLAGVVLTGFAVVFRCREGRLWRLMSLPFAIGGACCGMVPIRLLFRVAEYPGAEALLEPLHEALTLALFAFAVPRVCYWAGKIAASTGKRELRWAAISACLGIAAMIVIILAMLGGLLYGTIPAFAAYGLVVAGLSALTTTTRRTRHAS